MKVKVLSQHKPYTLCPFYTGVHAASSYLPRQYQHSLHIQSEHTGKRGVTILQLFQLTYLCSWKCQCSDSVVTGRYLQLLTIKSVAVDETPHRIDKDQIAKV